jgi:anti-sigma regulatory factor (Ser/Thr protein kinase)
VDALTHTKGTIMAGTLTNSIRLVAVVTAVASARQFTADMLKLWSVPDVLADDACLITSELVTNAVKMTGTLEPEPSPDVLAELPVIGLRLTLAHDRLFIEVVDTSCKPPELKQQYATADSGRGLFLVAMLADRWSYYRFATGGKVVWAELAVDDSDIGNALRLPSPTVSRPVSALTGVCGACPV